METGAISFDGPSINVVLVQVEQWQELVYFSILYKYSLVSKHTAIENR